MKVFFQYSEIYEVPNPQKRRLCKLRKACDNKFSDRAEAIIRAGELNGAFMFGSRYLNNEVFTRAKPKYMSWPTILGGQWLDDKYWPAYKRHDNAYGKDGAEKMPYLHTRDDADVQMYRDLIDLGCGAFLAGLQYRWVQLFNARRWRAKS